MQHNFSLIMATLGRSIEVEQFFISLVRQIYTHFELIVVDQNNDRRVFDICEKYKNLFCIRYIKSNQPGLSRNRNIGLKYVMGDVIAFPDDDCEYKPDTLQFVNDFFNNNGTSGLFSFNCMDRVSSSSYLPKRKYKISFLNIMRSGISFTVFLRKEAINNCFFDEQFGVGEKFGACEESELIMQLLSIGVTGIYDGTYFVFHPQKKKQYNIRRIYSYGMGCGAFHKKCIWHYKSCFFFLRFCWLLIRNIAAIVVCKQKKYYFYSLKGKIDGFREYHAAM
jgi:glycosyltransferase involved in cell wall biosynthesis